MKRALVRTAVRFGRVGLLVLLAGCAARAEVVFYTENWSSLNNWTVLAGSPVAGSAMLRNSLSNPNVLTRLLYTPGPPTQDYSIQTPLVCGTTAGQYIPNFSHYLRVSGSNYYRVEARNWLCAGV